MLETRNLFVYLLHFCFCLMKKGRSYGCQDLKDKIKLPRIPRKKPTTTTAKSTKPEMTEPEIAEPEIRYIDPNCHQNLAQASCEAIDSPLIKYIYDDLLDESYLKQARVSLDYLPTCQSILKYKKCIDLNFYIKCQKTFAHVFEKLDHLSKKCVENPKFKKESLLNSSSLTKLNYYSWLFFSFFALLLFFQDKI